YLGSIIEGTHNSGTLALPFHFLGESAILYSVYPNPRNTDTAHMRIRGAESEFCCVTLVNVLGIILGTVPDQTGTSERELSTANLPARLFYCGGK
ncbi:MAG TPA: hypothetical protein VGM92_01690, partial [Candidatus Kapabacteria bacterium]